MQAPFFVGKIRVKVRFFIKNLFRVALPENCEKEKIENGRF